MCAGTRTADAMDARPDEGMEGGVFAPYGGKYEGSGRDRGLTPFPRTSEEQGSKIQKRGAESTFIDPVDDVVGHRPLPAGVRMGPVDASERTESLDLMVADPEEQLV